MTAPLQIYSAASRMGWDSLAPSPVSFLRRQPTPAPNSVPPQFKWVSIRMDLTSWAVIALLSIIGGGIWSTGAKLTDLGYTVTSVKANDGKQDEVNQRQDAAIGRLEITLAKQQGYLEQILEAVRSGERRLQQ